MNSVPSLPYNVSSAMPAEKSIYYPYPPIYPSNYPNNHSTTASQGSGGKPSHAVTPGVLTVIAVLATAFILVSYYRIFGQYCAALLWRNRRRRQLPDDNNHAILDFEVGTSNGIDEALIDKIPVYSFREEDVLIDSTECSVCLSEFQDHEHLRLLPKCGHAFHLPCIDTWLNSHSNCPLCRAPIFLIQQAPPNAAPPNSAARQPQQEITPSYEPQPPHESAPDQRSSPVVSADSNSYAESRSANSSISRARGLPFSLLLRLPSTATSDEGRHRIKSKSSLSQSNWGSRSGGDHGLEIEKQSVSQKWHGLLPLRMRLLSRAFSVQETNLGDKKGHPMRRHSSTRRQPFPQLRRSNSTGSFRDASRELFELRGKLAGRPTSLSVDASSSSVPSASLLIKKSKSSKEQYVVVDISEGASFSSASASGSANQDQEMMQGLSAIGSGTGEGPALSNTSSSAASKTWKWLNSSHEWKSVRSNNYRSTALSTSQLNANMSHESKPKEKTTEIMAGDQSTVALSRSGSLKAGSTMKRSFSGGRFFHFLHGRRHFSEIPRQLI
ncbi:hypothetical protein O6H91_07G020200 [Diphasiastrum complanatum]|uniref:Uncharacterized protein n=1 Tax=Diphasiastrum complanatum TaxID=34168 RepID=A0ACC2D2Y9_DIPCM|nr:hypothetical protein O6H91_07G020200 [Diphasiastrum complanatum]